MGLLRLHIAAGRATIAQVNAGLTIVANVPNRAYRVVDCAMIARGGAVTEATAVKFETTHTTPVVIWTANAAALTENVIARPSLASGGDHAIGAGFNADLKPGGGIRILSTGTDESTCTSVDYVVQYVMV